jgi:hypothetical protein
MFTADYCGMAETPINSNSGSALFTKNGTPIRIDFPNGPYTPTEASGFLRSPSEPVTVDGWWDQDGATCIGIPRLEAGGDATVQSAIDSTCDLASHTHQGCNSQPPTGSVISYNPPPDAGAPPPSDAGVPPQDAYPPPSDADPTPQL